MEYTVTQVRNVLRNYESLVVKKRGDPFRAVSTKQTGEADNVYISKEGLRKLVELQQVGTDNV
ncbi:MAG: hypothetical protein HY201_05805 [Nitrospirae bacterium]|nr:hypothetical protein [Candidatus Troglogloeales bacterium]MBI3598941.1 hypothetical protein [Candidatus Troglogloeales bacterium]